MGHPGTEKTIFDRVVEFAKEIGVVPIILLKEQNGYVLNTLLVPFLNAAVDLLLNDVSDVESIDKTWMISTNSPLGPCMFTDLIGMKTAYDINKLWGEKLEDQGALNRASFIKTNYIDKGKMGLASGEGFYKYPNPAFENPDFLKN